MYIFTTTITLEITGKWGAINNRIDYNKGGIGTTRSLKITEYSSQESGSSAALWASGPRPISPVFRDRPRSARPPLHRTPGSWRWSARWSPITRR